MKLTIDELLEAFEALGDQEKIDFLNQAAMSTEACDDLPGYKLPIEVVRPITREDGY